MGPWGGRFGLLLIRGFLLFSDVFYRLGSGRNVRNLLSIVKYNVSGAPWHCCVSIFCNHLVSYVILLVFSVIWLWQRGNRSPRRPVVDSVRNQAMMLVGGTPLTKMASTTACRRF